MIAAPAAARWIAAEPAAAPVTPYLRMDLGAVAAAYRRMAAALPDVAIHYAMKCNPAPEVLATLHGLGCRFEIASAPELDALRALGVRPEEVLFSNPVKPAAHVQRAYAAGTRRFAVDGVAELVKIAAVAPGSAVYARLAVADGSSDVPSEGKFGVDEDAAAALLLAARDLGLEPYGLAFHVGSQMLDPAPWARAIRASARVMRALATRGVRLRMLDIGGGFPAAYDAPVPPIEAFGRTIRAALAHLPYPVEVVAEPGRGLVAEAGVMVATVIGVAERAGRRWVHLDVGAFNGMMESLETGNRLRYPVSDGRGERERVPVHLTGPTCDSQDTLLYDVPLSAGIAAGDEVRIGTAGAYTTSYASTFNGFDIPATHCA